MTNNVFVINIEPEIKLTCSYKVLNDMSIGVLLITRCLRFDFIHTRYKRNGVACCQAGIIKNYRIHRAILFRSGLIVSMKFDYEALHTSFNIHWITIRLISGYDTR